MIERVERALWVWGEWASSYRPGNSGSLISQYGQRGVMSTNPDYDNPVAEEIDRILAALPPYLNLSKKAIKRKFMFHWRNADAAKDLKISRSNYERQIERGIIYIDAKLGTESDIEKNLCFAYS